MVQFLNRSQCGMRAPNPARLTPTHDAQIGYTVHITGSATSDPVGKWRQIQALAMDGKLPSGDRYGDTPYGAGVALDGRVLEGRDSRWRGAHALSHDNLANRLTVGIAIIDDGRNIPGPVIKALEACAFLFVVRYRRPPLWFCHSDWNAPDGSSTDCPGHELRAIVRELRRH